MSENADANAAHKGETDGASHSRHAGKSAFGLSRETRFGLAAALSFVVLIGVLVWNKTHPKSPDKKKDVAAGGLASASDPTSKLPRMEIGGGAQTSQTETPTAASDTPPTSPAPEPSAPAGEKRENGQKQGNEPPAPESSGAPGKERSRRDSAAPAERAEYTVTESAPVELPRSTPPPPSGNDPTTKDSSAPPSIDLPGPASTPTDSGATAQGTSGPPLPTPVAAEEPKPGAGPSGSDPPLPTPVDPPSTTKDGPADIPPIQTPAETGSGKPSSGAQANPAGTSQTSPDAATTPTPTPPATPASAEGTSSSTQSAASDVTPPGTPIPDIGTTPTNPPVTPAPGPAPAPEHKAEELATTPAPPANPPAATAAASAPTPDASGFMELPTIGKGRSLQADPFALEPAPARFGPCPRACRGRDDHGRGCKGVTLSPEADAPECGSQLSCSPAHRSARRELLDDLAILLRLGPILQGALGCQPPHGAEDR